MNRPTQEQRETVAADIRRGGDAQGETMMEEVGLTAGTPILDEAKAEREEGGGPIADAVGELEEKIDEGADLND